MDLKILQNLQHALRYAERFQITSFEIQLVTVDESVRTQVLLSVLAILIGTIANNPAATQPNSDKLTRGLGVEYSS